LVLGFGFIGNPAFVASLSLTVYLIHTLTSFFSESPPLPTLRPARGSVASRAPSFADRAVNGNVQGGKLLRKVKPAYPATVHLKSWIPQLIIIKAAVDERGNIVGTRILRGHPVCNDAALQAVRKWRYSPLILNGKRISSIQRIALRCGESPVVQR